jgi:hypothetical protein
MAFLSIAIRVRPLRHADFSGGLSVVSRRPMIKPDHICHILHFNNGQQEST